jgi:hypothetical protein
MLFEGVGGCSACLPAYLSLRLTVPLTLFSLPVVQYSTVLCVYACPPQQLPRIYPLLLHAAIAKVCSPDPATLKPSFMFATTDTLKTCLLLSLPLCCCYASLHVPATLPARPSALMALVVTSRVPQNPRSTQPSIPCTSWGKAQVMGM